MGLIDKGALEIAQLFRTGEVSALEVAEAFLERLAGFEPAIYAMMTVTSDTARAQAIAADERKKLGEDVGPLGGVPCILKDNLVTRGVTTTAGSKMLADYLPPHSATVVQRLLHAGAVSLGKANLDEFAMGSSTENSAYFVTKNPWDLSRVPGGSSGGSAAAVAAREASFALGSDTGGSIRQPAAFCGLVGLKPSYGRVSRFGLIAFASSLDQIGPITHSVADAALVLEVIAGADPKDQTASREGVGSYLRATEEEVSGLSFAVPASYYKQADPALRQAVDEAARALERAGMERVELDLEHTEYALDAYYLIAPSEASSNLARYDGVRYGTAAKDQDEVLARYLATRGRGFGAEVKRRIMIGTYALSAGYYDAFYLRAQKARAVIREEFGSAFQKVDVLLTPTTPTTAFPIGAKVDDPLEMYRSDILTVPANLAGVPALSLPWGKDGGLPIGVQLIGRSFDEATLLKVARRVEAAAPPLGEVPERGFGLGV